MAHNVDGNEIIPNVSESEERMNASQTPTPLQEESISTEEVARRALGLPEDAFHRITVAPVPPLPPSSDVSASSAAQAAANTATSSIRQQRQRGDAEESGVSTESALHSRTRGSRERVTRLNARQNVLAKIRIGQRRREQERHTKSQETSRRIDMAEQLTSAAFSAAQLTRSSSIVDLGQIVSDGVGLIRASHAATNTQGKRLLRLVAPIGSIVLSAVNLSSSLAHSLAAVNFLPPPDALTQTVGTLVSFGQTALSVATAVRSRQAGDAARAAVSIGSLAVTLMITQTP